MVRRSVFALGLVAVASLLLRTLSGCGTSNGSAGSPDAGEDATGNDANVSPDAGDGAFIPHPCNGGCLCFAADACPTGCYPSVTEQPDGAGSEPFCSNGITQCVPGGFSWSFRETTSCPGLHPPGSQTALPDYPVTYLDSGPDGAFCCDLEYEYALISEAAADTGADGAVADAVTGDAADASAE